MTVRQLASKSCYLVGCFLLIPGSILFLPPYATNATTGVDLYIVACTFLTLAALIDLVASIWNVFAVPSSSTGPSSSTPLMQNGDVNSSDIEKGSHSHSHSHSNSPTFIDLLQNHSFLNSVAMVIGGVLFLIASVFYLYSKLTTTGTWVFRFGSISYMLGTSLSLSDLIKASHTEKPSVSVSTIVWIAVCVLFLLGSLLFITGGVLSQLGHTGAAVCWLLGSISFFLGAVGMEEEVVRQHLGTSE